METIRDAAQDAILEAVHARTEVSSHWTPVVIEKSWLARYDINEMRCKTLSNCKAPLLQSRPISASHAARLSIDQLYEYLEHLCHHLPLGELFSHTQEIVRLLSPSDIDELWLDNISVRVQDHGTIYRIWLSDILGAELPETASTGSPDADDSTLAEMSGNEGEQDVSEFWPFPEHYEEEKEKCLDAYPIGIDCPICEGFRFAAPKDFERHWDLTWCEAGWISEDFFEYEGPLSQKINRWTLPQKDEEQKKTQLSSLNKTNTVSKDRKSDKKHWKTKAADWQDTVADWELAEVDCKDAMTNTDHNSGTSSKEEEAEE